MTVGRITGEFADRVGGDGFADIKRNVSCPGRSIWSCLFVLAWAMVFYQVFEYIKNYFSYPINTKVELKFDASALFPAVSFCNLNPVRFSYAAAFDDTIHDKLKQQRVQPEAGSGGPGPTSSSYSAPMGWDSLSSFVSTDTGASHYIDEAGTELWNPNMIPEDVQNRALFYASYFKIPDADKKEVGHQLQDMMAECVWKERQCFPSNWTHFLHPLYGNCYSFNPGFNNDRAIISVETTSMPGPRDGLSVTLFLEEDEYIPLLTDSVGIRLHVHDQGASPRPAETGYTLSSGFSTALEIRKVKITRLPLPYNNENCSDNTYPYQSLVQQYWPPANYTKATCTKLCFQDLLLTNCSCVDPEVLYLGDHGSVNACDMSDDVSGLCMEKVKSEYRKGKIGMNCTDSCPQACSEIDFEVNLSSAQWPNSYYIVCQTVFKLSFYGGKEVGHCQEILKEVGRERLSGLSTLIDDQEKSDEDVRHNTLHFSVYYQSLNYRVILEEPSYVVGFSPSLRLSGLSTLIDDEEKSDEDVRHSTLHFSVCYQSLNYRVILEEPSYVVGFSPSLRLSGLSTLIDDKEKSDEDVRHSTLHFSVYYQSLNYRVILEEPSYVVGFSPSLRLSGLSTLIDDEEKSDEDVRHSTLHFSVCYQSLNYRVILEEPSYVVGFSPSLRLSGLSMLIDDEEKSDEDVRHSTLHFSVCYQSLNYRVILEEPSYVVGFSPSLRLSGLSTLIDDEEKSDEDVRHSTLHFSVYYQSLNYRVILEEPSYVVGFSPSLRLSGLSTLIDDEEKSDEDVRHSTLHFSVCYQSLNYRVILEEPSYVVGFSPSLRLSGLSTLIDDEEKSDEDVRHSTLHFSVYYQSLNYRVILEEPSYVVGFSPSLRLSGLSTLIDDEEKSDEDVRHSTLHFSVCYQSLNYRVILEEPSYVVGFSPSLRLSGLSTLIDDEEKSDEDVRYSTLHFSVYYQSLNYRVILEEPSYVVGFSPSLRLSGLSTLIDDEEKSDEDVRHSTLHFSVCYQSLNYRVILEEPSYVVGFSPSLRLSGLSTLIDDEEKSDEDVRHSTLHFSVYYQSLNYRVILEEPSYVVGFSPSLRLSGLSTLIDDEEKSDEDVRHNTLHFSVYYQSINYCVILEEPSYVVGFCPSLPSLVSNQWDGGGIVAGVDAG